jgi:hypothetical protein
MQDVNEGIGNGRYTIAPGRPEEAREIATTSLPAAPDDI